MITGGDRGKECSGRWGNISVQTFSNLFRKTFTEGAVTTEAWSFYQYITNPLLRL